MFEISEQPIIISTFVADMVHEKLLNLYKKDLRLLEDYWEFYQLIGIIESHNKTLSEQEWQSRNRAVQQLQKMLIETSKETDKNFDKVTGHETLQDKKKQWHNKVINDWNKKTFDTKILLTTMMSRDESRIITPFITTTRSIKLERNTDLPTFKGIIGYYDDFGR